MRDVAKVMIGITAFLVVASPLPAQQQQGGVVVASLPSSPPAAVDASAVRAAIEKANAQWLRGVQTGDAAAMAAIYADDASLFPPGEAILEGPQDIVAFLQSQRTEGMTPPILKTADVTTMGSIAYEVGTYGFPFADGSGLTDTGKYFAIWKAQPDGTWKYHVGIWTSAADATIR